MLNSIPDFDSSEAEFHALLNLPLGAHPPFAVLRALGQEVLPADIETAASVHVAACALCKALLADFASLTEPSLTMQEERRIASTLPAGRNPRTRTLAKARLGWSIAATLLLIGGLFLLHRGTREPATQAPTVARVVTTPAPAPPTPPMEIALTSLAAPGADPALVTRGGAAYVPNTGQLLPAFKAYNEGNYTLAVERFKPLAAAYPQSQLTLLYLGVSELFLQRNADAAATLRKARAAHAVSDPDAATWYSAVAASRLKTSDERTLLAGLCGQKASPYSQRSCAALATLR